MSCILASVAARSPDRQDALSATVCKCSVVLLQHKRKRFIVGYYSAPIGEQSIVVSICVVCILSTEISGTTHSSFTKF